MRIILNLVAGLVLANSAGAGEALLPEMVEVGAGTFSYRPAGEFILGGTSVIGPPTVVRFDMPLLIMNRQVSAKDYGLCEAEGVCRPLGRPSANADVPVTGVSFSDALDYAAWLSRKSGTTYRLPTDAEWAFAAKERFYGDPLGDGATQANPAANQVSRYLAAAVLTAPDPVVHPAGHFGANANGLLDLSGNVWEWTSTCYQRARLEADGLAIASSNENCGVRVLEGRHRAYLSYFLGDAKGGGCSIGTAPDHLGFRLVQEAGMLDFVKHWFARQWSALAN